MPDIRQIATCMICKQFAKEKRTVCIILLLASLRSGAALDAGPLCCVCEPAAPSRGDTALAAPLPHRTLTYIHLQKTQCVNFIPIVSAQSCIHVSLG